MMFLPISIIASDLNTSLIFFQISSNQSLIAFHFSSMVPFTLSQISESLSLIASNTVVASNLIAFQRLETNALIAFHLFSQETLITCNVLAINTFTASIALLIVSLIFPQISIAKADTSSQCWYRSTPAVIRAVIAMMTSPIGLVRKAIAAPKAVVTVVAIAHTAFHATVAAVMAI